MRAADLLGRRDTPALRSMLMPVTPEEVRVRPFPRWLRAAVPAWVQAVTLPWGVFVRMGALSGDAEALSRLVAHELAHVRQWRTEGAVAFLRHYLADYTRGRLRRLGHRDAYRAIGYEAQACQFEDIV